MTINRKALNLQNASGPDIVIQSHGLRLKVVAKLGDQVPVITGGYGGWQVVNRIRNVGLTEWNGIDPRKMTLALVLDGFEDNRDQEPFIRNLELMARPDPLSGGQPPFLTIIGGIPANRSVKWYINGITWTDPIIRRNEDYHRIRQGVTLDLIEMVAATSVLTRSAAQRRALVGKKTRVVKALKDDTPKKIAKRVLKDVNRWKEIVKLNKKLKSPDTKIPIGTKVRVPAK